MPEELTATVAIGIALRVAVDISERHRPPGPLEKPFELAVDIDILAIEDIPSGRVIDPPGALEMPGKISVGGYPATLEDALPGQTFRVRNPRTRREFLAQVHDEQTVLLLL